MSAVYYNENDPYCTQWLAALAQAGHVPSGDIDGRSIRAVEAEAVAGATHAHFFAGIGGWPYALRLAGWSDDAPIWTGSCPCQPFSQAGRGRGVADDRHLWPEWFRLIRECRPSIVVGEQVASPAGLAWFDAVSTDLEGAGYAVASADLCAAGVGAPHIRQRLYFVAVAGGERREGIDALLQQRRPYEDRVEVARRAAPGLVVDADHEGSQGRGECRDGADQRIVGATGVVGELGDPCRARSGWDGRAIPRAQAACARTRFDAWHLADEPVASGAACEWIACTDGKARPVESGTFPLAHGVPARVGRLRAYGNAIVPQVAATFLQAVMDVLHG